MTALCEYELEREQRVAENKRRMEEMGILKVPEPSVCEARMHREGVQRAFTASVAYRIAFSYST